MNQAFKGWLHGLGAATISAFAGGISGMATLPSVFNFTHDGLVNVAKLTVLPAILAAGAYLKASPLPSSIKTAKLTETATGSTLEVKEEQK